MSKFCYNCGKPIDENANICMACGANNYPIKKKVPGKGLGIASMVLGIVAIYNAIICAFMSIIMIMEGNIVFEEKIIFSIIFNFWPFVMSITGISLGIASICKNKLGMTIAGVILNSITIFICLASIIITFVI